MANEEKDVKQEDDTSSEVSTEQNDSETNETDVSEDVKTPEEVVSRDVYENVKKSMQEERNRRKEAERRLQETRDTPLTPPSDDAVYQDYLRTKADAFIAKQMVTDPTFKDRIEDVEFYLRQGHPIDMADKMAKSDLADKLLTEIAKDAPKETAPKQLKTNAVPEEERPTVSYADIKSGKDKSAEAQKLRTILGTFN